MRNLLIGHSQKRECPQLACKIYSQIVRASGRGHAQWNIKTSVRYILRCFCCENVRLAPGKLTWPQYLMQQEMYQLKREKFKPKREMGACPNMALKKTGDLPLKRKTWQLWLYPERDSVAI